MLTLPADTSAIYIGCEQINDTTCPLYPKYYHVKVWKYDNVDSWQPKANFCDGSGDVSWDKITLLVSPSDPKVMYIGGIRLKQIYNTHFTHHDDGSNIHDDIRYAKIYQQIPSDSGKTDIIFMGTDGGIRKTSEWAFLIAKI